MGTLMRFEIRGRIENTIYMIQEWKESEKIPTSLDWEIIHDSPDKFYEACTMHNITQKEVIEFLDAFRYENY